MRLLKSLPVIRVKFSVIARALLRLVLIARWLGAVKDVRAAA